MEQSRSISSVLRAMEVGETTSVEQVSACVQATDQHDATLGVFLHRNTEVAHEHAMLSDARRGQGLPPRSLEGIPVGIKDNFLTVDEPTTAQSRIPVPQATANASSVSRLLEAGAISMGKTTTMEFAVGFNLPDAPFPAPKNPWNTEHWTGGSSSGTGSGIQAGMFLGGLGSDTAGSVRMPAAWCGVSGHKPTYGLVPRTGVVPLAWTLDHPGPLARTAEDCALLLSVIAGADGFDRAVSPSASFNFTPTKLETRGLRVGLAVNPLQRSVAEVQEYVSQAAELFRSLGASISEITLPYYEEVIDSTMLGLAAEGFAYHRSNLQGNWDDYGAPARSALVTGALMSSSDYIQTLRVRATAQAELTALFQEHDLIFGPTATQEAPRFDALDFGEVVGMLQTHYWNATGHPALSVPMGFVNGLPVGLQIIGRPFEDQAVLDAGRIWQEHTNYHTEVAPI